MAIKIGQTNAQSSGGGNSGIDFNSIYLLYGGYEASFGLDGLDVYYFDLEEIGYDLQNLDASMPSKSDFQQGQLIYALDEYGKYLKHIWEVIHLDSTDDNKLIVSDYGEIKDTPLVEIIGTQAKGTPNEYTLERMQYFYFMTNEVVKVKFPSDDNEYTYVKSLVDDTTGNLVFNRAEWDSTNSQYVIDTLTIDTNFDMVHSTEVLSSGGGGSQLYQHNISITIGLQQTYAVRSSISIVNDISTPMTFDDLVAYLYSKGYHGKFVGTNYDINAKYTASGGGKDPNNGWNMVVTNIIAYSNDGGSTYDRLILFMSNYANWGTETKYTIQKTMSNMTIEDSMNAI